MDPRSDPLIPDIGPLDFSATIQGVPNTFGAKESAGLGGGGEEEVYWVAGDRREPKLNLGGSIAEDAIEGRSQRAGGM